MYTIRKATLEDLKSRYMELHQALHEKISSFDPDEKYEFPLHRISLIKALLDKEGYRRYLNDLLDIEFNEYNKNRSSLDYLAGMNGSLLVNTAKLLLDYIDKNFPDLRNTPEVILDFTKQNFRKELERVETMETKIGILKGIVKNSKVETAPITNISYQGSFRHPHVDYLRFIDLALERAHELKLPNPQILIWTLYNHIRKDDMHKTYHNRIAQLKKAFKDRNDIIILDIPGDNYDDYASTITSYLAEFNNNQLYWLWGSDNFIKFVTPGNKDGSYSGVLNHPGIKIMTSKRSETDEETFLEACEIVRKKYSKDVIILPSRDKIHGQHVSSTLLKSLDSNDPLYKKLSLV